MWEDHRVSSGPDRRVTRSGGKKISVPPRFSQNGIIRPLLQMLPKILIFLASIYMSADQALEELYPKPAIVRLEKAYFSKSDVQEIQKISGSSIDIPAIVSYYV